MARGGSLDIHYIPLQNPNDEGILLSCDAIFVNPCLSFHLFAQFVFGVVATRLRKNYQTTTQKDTTLLMSCPTCKGLKEIDCELPHPMWGSPPGTPNQIIRVECPDCVSCVQCANPDHDGIHSCRDFNPTYEG